jgi:acetolactate synthase-1/2/3 large subunit
MKYAQLIATWLKDLGYTHCFFVAGGNIMHLLDAVRTTMECVPFVHEVAAGIAVEGFNESAEEGKRAFALVTAGPGLTNIVTALAGAWLESHELLVLGGQVKRSDLATDGIRQRGIQEVDGAAIVSPITKASVRLMETVDAASIAQLVELGRTGRRGPVFIEIPLDVQGAPVDAGAFAPVVPSRDAAPSPAGLRSQMDAVREMIVDSERPVMLLGGGLSRGVALALSKELASIDVPVMTTWNGTDRIDADAPNYFGRPNTWGMRYSNILIQQSDLVVALGTRLGYQQTGFNWQSFAPLAKIVQVDIDEAELRKGHPRVDLPICADANDCFATLLGADLGEHARWMDFCREVRQLLPTADPANTHDSRYIDPFEFAVELSKRCDDRDMILPGSSGGAFTTMMQAFRQKSGQIFLSDKGLASMGYGLSMAIGVALSHPERRTILAEGDGGFSQNLQELATVVANRLNVKMFIHSNEGYASIRMTQRNYFGGEYLGCDTRTGLGFPDWLRLFSAYDVPVIAMDHRGFDTPGAQELFEARGPAAFIVPVDPEQTYFPKISSRVTASGSMESSPLHLMSPDLDPHLQEQVLRYLTTAGSGVQSTASSSIG